MPINPIQLPKWEQAPTVDWKPLNAIGDAIADNRRRTAEAEAFGGLVDAIPDRPERAPGAPAPGQPGRELPRGLRNNNPGNIEDGPTAKGLPGYKDTGAPFLAWLYGIARHVMADEFRRRARVEPRADLPDGRVEWKVDDELTLAAAIRGLPDEQRQVIELKFLMGATNAEVAAALGKSEGAVNAKQWRALGALRKMLEEA